MAPLRQGVAPHLEAEADRLIKESFGGTTRYSDKLDVLTPWKEKMRRGREVYNSTGVADPQVRRGNFHRPLNRAYPHLNSTEGALPVRTNRDSLGDHVEANMLHSDPPSSAMDDFWR